MGMAGSDVIGCTKGGAIASVKSPNPVMGACYFFEMVTQQVPFPHVVRICYGNGREGRSFRRYQSL